MAEMLPPLLERVKALGYKVYTNGDWDMNIIAERSKNRKAGKFDDRIFLAYKVQGQWRQNMFTCTTDPGTYYLKTASKDFGQKATAVVKPGQYPKSYCIGSHTGYTALVQRGPLKIYRDGNMDEVVDYDESTVKEGSRMGINIHRASASRVSEKNTNWSAGCCVLNDPVGFEEFMRICQKQVRQRGWKWFTYTLIEAE